MFHRSAIIAATALFASACFDFAGLKSGGGPDAASDLAGRDLTFVFRGCANGMKDGDESDIDCGGATCPRCADGKMCFVPGDCASNRCEGKLCTSPPMSCMNAAKDGDESDVDCGGATCPKCGDGKACTQPSDCTSNACTNNLCGAPDPTCNDNQKNGMESDVDCGGPTCQKCGLGKMCLQARDCTSGNCAANKCAQAQPKALAFAPAEDYPTKGRPYGIVASDINGDGKVDLATGTAVPYTLHALFGKGDGTFQFGTNAAPKEGPLSIAAADFNGDKKSDLAVAYTTCQVGCTLGAGIALGAVGGFQVSVGFDVPPPVGTASVATGDFNGDGKQDLAFTSGDGGANYITVVLGAGDGTFGPLNRINAGFLITNTTRNLAAADLNGDGRSDLITLDKSLPAVRVFLAAVNGTFSKSDNEPNHVLKRSDGSPYSISTADLNEDGKLDAIVTLGSSDVDVLLGKGGGIFGSARRFSVANQAFCTAVADFNVDGHLDVVMSNGLGSDATVVLGHGDGSLDQPAKFAVGKMPRCVTARDFNGDGKPDVATTSAEAESISVLLNVSK